VEEESAVRPAPSEEALARRPAPAEAAEEGEAGPPSEERPVGSEERASASGEVSEPDSSGPAWETGRPGARVRGDGVRWPG